MDDVNLDEFVKNRYIGYSPTTKQLNEEFYRFLAGQHSNYLLIVGNLTLLNGGDNLFSALAHIKEIALSSSITRDNIVHYITGVFVGLLRGTRQDVRETVRAKTFHDFKLYGTRQDDIMNAFYNAIEILER